MYNIKLMEILDLLYCTFLILFGCTYLLFNYKFYCKQKNASFICVEGDSFSGAYEVVKESESVDESEGDRFSLRPPSGSGVEGESTTEYEFDDDDRSSGAEGDRSSGASVDSYIKNIKKEIDIYKNYILIMENKLDIYLSMTSSNKLLYEGEIEMDVTTESTEHQNEVDMDVTTDSKEYQDDVEMDTTESTEHQDEVDIDVTTNSTENQDEGDIVKTDSTTRIRSDLDIHTL
jgi:hypothetical protein